MPRRTITCRCWSRRFPTAPTGAAERGCLHPGMPGLPAALAARGGGDRLDRRILLFRGAGPRPRNTQAAGAGPVRRILVGARRRFLSQAEIPAGARAAAGKPALVQMEIVYDLDVGLRAVLPDLSAVAAGVSDRSVTDRVDLAAGRGTGDRVSDRRLVRV